MKIHCEPGYEQRTFSTADWLDEQNNHLFHERTYWGYSINRNSRREKTPAELYHVAYKAATTGLIVHYWMDVTYTVLDDANKDAKEFDGVVQLHPYCDEENSPAWFMSFNDFDKAMVYLRTKTGINYIAE